MLCDIKPNSERWLNVESLPNEEWKDIKDFEGLYQVSNYGRIKSLMKISKTNGRIYPTIILKCHVNTKKYLDVDLCKNGKSKRYRIHRLVANSFLHNENDYPQVNHIDGNKSNNTLSNLEWCDNSMNQKHAFLNNLNHRGKYGYSPKSKRVYQYDSEHNFIREWDSIIRISHTLGYSDSFISQCCKRKYKRAYGYVWRYKEEIDNGMEI